MVRRSLQLNSTQINFFRLWHRFDLPSRIMRQWFCVSANAALNTRWIQFINHAKYKIIDSNVMDWVNVTKIHTPPSAKRYFPATPDEHALYKDNFATGNAFSPLEAAPLLVLTKRSAASGDENAEKECRKSLLTSHSVMEVCCSCFINTKHRCALPTCNKCSVFEENEDVEGIQPVTLL